LAALSMQGSQDIHAFITAFAGQPSLHHGLPGRKLILKRKNPVIPSANVDP
jgi:hypothetical protein